MATIQFGIKNDKEKVTKKMAIKTGMIESEEKDAFACGFYQGYNEIEPHTTYEQKMERASSGGALTTETVVEYFRGRELGKSVLDGKEPMPEFVSMK